MAKIFKVVFYLRGNYKNKDGKTPIMARMYLNKERMQMGNTGLSCFRKDWNKDKEIIIGKTKDILNSNLELENIKNKLFTIYKRLDVNGDCNLENIKSEYLIGEEKGKTILELFEKHQNDIEKQRGISISEGMIKKYRTCKKHFLNFLYHSYKRRNIALKDLNYKVIYDFNLYLRSVLRHKNNTVIKTLKVIKTIMILANKIGYMHHNPFTEMKFHLEPTNRGFLTDEEILKMANKKFDIKRLELVKDVFLFSCFTGLAYIDVFNLKKENIMKINNKDWLIVKRQKTRIETNILLLDIPKQIIKKYAKEVDQNIQLFPLISNQKLNSYLKEIADLCGIKKDLTFHLARHTFATMSLSKGVPIVSISKMLGHTNIRTTQIYARITNKKIEQDMKLLSSQLDEFNKVLLVNKK